MSRGFHEISFPLSIALGTTGGPERRTDIMLLSNGYESRNARWRKSRRRYDVGSGIKSAVDLYTLITFFEARQGSLNGFRFKDPLDHSSAGYGMLSTPQDQQIGLGNGRETKFQLTKSYTDQHGEIKRVIEKPVHNTVQIALDGREVQEMHFDIDYTTGWVEFTTPPKAGAFITAGYEFDVPVRFDISHLDINHDMLFFPFITFQDQS